VNPSGDHLGNRNSKKPLSFETKVQIENHVWKVFEVYISKVGSQFSFVKRYEAQIMVNKKVGNQMVV
jgi:hypothetical protein